MADRDGCPAGIPSGVDKGRTDPESAVAFYGSLFGWNAYVRVEDADESAVRAVAGGGRVLMAPFDVGAAGRMAVLADPAGESICVWQANEGARAVEGDPEARGRRAEMQALESFDGVVGRAVPAQGAPPSWGVTFAVSDTDATVARATALGGHVLVEPVDAGGVRFAVLSDPEGAVFTVGGRLSPPSGAACGSSRRSSRRPAAPLR